MDGSSGATGPDGTLLSSVEAALVEAGWSQRDLLINPTILTPAGTRRPTLALTYADYPMATLDIVSGDRAEAPTSWKNTDSDRYPFPVCLASDGRSTWQCGAGDGRRWTVVPTPEEVWHLLGREWNSRDPRLFESPLKATPPMHYVCAVGAALDAIEAGRRRVQLVMAQGTGAVSVATNIIWKLIGSGRRRRALFLTTRRASAEHIEHQLKGLGPRLNTTRLPGARASDSGGVNVATIAYFLFPNRAHLDELPEDYYDAIVVMDLRDGHAGWRHVAEHFPAAVVLGFSPDGRVAGFDETAFEFTVDDALAAEELQVLPGFRRLRLGEIASVASGLNGFNGLQVDELSLVKARSVPVDEPLLTCKSYDLI